MIISRYFSRQLLTSTAAVAAVLVMILVFGRLVKFLAEAAAGRISGDVVFIVMAYRLPGFLELILPLALFLGILLAYGRMYLENEMVVLEACGVSQTRLLGFALLPTLLVSILVGLFSLYISPLGAANSDKILQQEKRRSGLEVLTPGRFHASRDGKTVTYTESVSRDDARMENLLIVHNDSDNPKRVALIAAANGSYRIDEASGSRYLVLLQGTRFQGEPGKSNFNRAVYGQYDIKIEQQAPYDPSQEVKNLPTLTLWQRQDATARAELHWRIAIPLLVPIVVFLAVPLSRVNPRQGRYLKLLPAIMLYLAYLSLLLAGKNAIAKGSLDPHLGLFWIHGSFLLLALLVHRWPNIRLWLRQRQQLKQSQVEGVGDANP